MLRMNPTSVHIYDKLIKLLGKIKRYESIHLLLKSAEDDLSQSLAEKKWGTKEHKKYLKALQHIQGEKEKALRNARNRAIVECGPICLGGDYIKTERLMRGKFDSSKAHFIKYFPEKLMDELTMFKV